MCMEIFSKEVEYSRKEAQRNPLELSPLEKSGLDFSPSYLVAIYLDI